MASPRKGQFVGRRGFVDDVADAVDIRGPAGAGQGAAAFATEAQAEAGTSTVLAINPATLHAVFQHLQATASDLTAGTADKWTDAAAYKALADRVMPPGLGQTAVDARIAALVEAAARTGVTLTDEQQRLFRERIGAAATGDVGTAFSAADKTKLDGIEAGAQVDRYDPSATPTAPANAVIENLVIDDNDVVLQLQQHGVAWYFGSGRGSVSDRRSLASTAVVTNLIRGLQYNPDNRNLFVFLDATADWDQLWIGKQFAERLITPTVLPNAPVPWSGNQVQRTQWRVVLPADEALTFDATDAQVRINLRNSATGAVWVSPRWRPSRRPLDDGSGVDARIAALVEEAARLGVTLTTDKQAAFRSRIGAVGVGDLEHVSLIETYAWNSSPLPFVFTGEDTGIIIPADAEIIELQLKEGSERWVQVKVSDLLAKDAVADSGTQLTDANSIALWDRGAPGDLGDDLPFRIAHAGNRDLYIRVTSASFGTAAFRFRSPLWRNDIRDTFVKIAETTVGDSIIADRGNSTPLRFFTGADTYTIESTRFGFVQIEVQWVGEGGSLGVLSLGEGVRHRNAVFLAELRASTAYAAGQANGVRISTVSVSETSSGNKQGDLSLWLARNAANELGYWFRYENAISTGGAAGQHSIQARVQAALLRQA